MIVMLTYNQKFFLKALGTFIISPVYIPVVILYENRSDIIDFYKEVFMVLKGTHPELKDENNG